MAKDNRNIPAVPAALIQRISAFSTATLHEAMDREGAMDCSISPFGRGGEPADRRSLYKHIWEII